MKLCSICVPSFPLSSPTEKEADAPGRSAAIPMGVSVGSIATAGAIASSSAPRSWSSKLRAHLVPERVDDEVGNSGSGRADRVGIDTRLREGTRHRPARALERIREACRHLLQELVVAKADDRDRLLGLGIVVHAGDPAVETALETVDFEPAIGVGRHPLARGT